MVGEQRHPRGEPDVGMPGRDPREEHLRDGHDEVAEVVLADDHRAESGRGGEVEVVEDLLVALGLGRPLAGRRVGPMVAEGQ